MNAKTKLTPKSRNSEEEVEKRRRKIDLRNNWLN
jgi:hypothetical protein